MPALEVIAIVVLLALPWLWLVRRELARLSDSAYLRAHGSSWLLSGAIAVGSIVVTWGLFIKFLQVLLPIEPFWWG